MKRYFIMGVIAAMALYAAPAKADVLFPECPPGVTPATSPYYCQMPLKFYEEPLFRMWSLVGSAALLSFLGLRVIRNRYVA